MVIGIDASQATKEQKTGVQWYSYYLLNALKRIVPQTHRVKLYSPTPLPPDLKPLPSHWQEKVLPWPLTQGWTLFKLSNELRKNSPDVFFTPGHIIPPFIKCKSVVTIHDLGFRECPDAYAHPRFMNFLHKRDATVAVKIIVPSQATKDAITQAYSISPDKIHIIPHGYDANVYHPYNDVDIQPTLEKHGIKKPYVIAVGRIEEKKNILDVLRLVQSIREQRHPELVEGSLHFGRDDVSDMTLVLVGTPGYGHRRIKQWIHENKAGEWVHELGWLPSDDTAKLISGASALITLSRAEGFGLTILEALACRTPVLASDIPVHREIGKDLVTYTDPNNLVDSGNKLINLINQSRNDATAKLTDRLTEITWSYAAHKTFRVLTTA